MENKMKQVIADINELTPEWLTGILTRKGHLTGGEVVAVRERVSKERLVSTSFFVDIDYSGDARGLTPRRMFVKIYKADLHQELMGRIEVQFYNYFPGVMPGLNAVTCYAADYDPVTNGAYVLLEDLTETHFSCKNNCTPEQYAMAVDRLAEFHAFWWDHPKLGTEVGKFITEAEFEAYIADLQGRFSAFTHTPGNEIPPEHIEIYERVFRSWRSLYRRMGQKNLTIIHGDASPVGNTLFPRDPALDKAFLIDWNYWHINLGTKDLSYLIALHLYPEQREKVEKTLLKRYLDYLQQHGVKTYDWDDLWHDYRISVVANLLVPVILCTYNNIPVYAWWPRYVKILKAFEDLNCRELLD